MFKICLIIALSPTPDGPIIIAADILAGFFCNWKDFLKEINIFYDGREQIHIKHKWYR